ncbi:MAG: helix-hairpin-helix domain-containing protein [Synergistales bacterium]|nr:helix-hairpin-helix domain-containing protein [Synergistales bacterium]
MIRDLLKQRKGLFLLAGGIICLCAAWLIIWSFSGIFPDEEPSTVAGPMPPARERTKEPEVSVKSEVTPSEEAPWVVYITGAVANPGVYEIPAGSRLFHLVEKAGGLSQRADTLRINLARRLEDGVHVHVPAIGDREQELPQDTSLLPNDQGKTIPGPSGLIQARGSGFPSGPESSLVDINRADLDSLQTLPGIGPKTAMSIISYREEHGYFSSPEELIKVKGIGDKKLEKLKTCISCGP